MRTLLPAARGCIAVCSIALTNACVGEISAPGAGNSADLPGPTTNPSDSPQADPNDPFAGDPNQPPVECDITGLAHTGLRRMNARELRQTVSQLLGVEIDDLALPSDGLSVEGYDTDASALKVLELDADRYYAAVSEGVERAFLAGTHPFASCTGAATERAACVEQQLVKFLRRAFRRPVPDQVAQRLTALRAAQPDETEGLKAALVGGLLSARSLYLGATTPSTAPGQLHLLDDFQLAERLSFFLWSSPPDDALLDQAQQGALSDQAGLERAATRLLDHPRFDGFLQGFVSSWLGLRNTADLRKNPERYPEYSGELLSDFLTETSLFAGDLLRGARPLAELLLAQDTYVNERLAGFYQLSGVSGADFRKVTLPPGTRRGLLNQGSVLTVTGGEQLPSPVKRGIWLARKLTCTEPPPPPPDVPTLELAEQQGLSPKAALEQHRNNAACAACHALIDPLGLSLENYDSIGRYRTTYQDGSPVDASGSWQGSSFNGSAELSELLAAQTLPACLATHLGTYVLGEVPNDASNCFVQSLVTRFEGGDRSFRGLVKQLVTSELFFKAVVKGEAQ